MSFVIRTCVSGAVEQLTASHSPPTLVLVIKSISLVTRHRVIARNIHGTRTVDHVVTRVKVHQTYLRLLIQVILLNDGTKKVNDMRAVSDTVHHDNLCSKVRLLR